jgi:hypothetical protein
MVLAAGFVTATAAAFMSWGIPTSGADLGSAAIVISVSEAPFVALAQARSRLHASVLGLSTAVFVVVTIVAFREGTSGDDSLSLILLFFLPLVLLASVPVIMLVDAVASQVRHRRIRHLHSPSLWQTALTLFAALVGLVTFGVIGIVAGVALGVALWLGAPTDSVTGGGASRPPD